MAPPSVILQLAAATVLLAPFAAAFSPSSFRLPHPRPPRPLSAVPKDEPASAGADVHDEITRDDDARGNASESGNLSRRSFGSQVIKTVAAANICAIIFHLNEALAGIDVSSLRSVPVEGDASGSAGRLKQLQMQGATIERGAGSDFTSMPARKTLDSGVIYVEIRAGRDGNRVVRRGSSVGATMKISTPEGIKVYSTRDDNDGNELAWTIGVGDLPRGLEEGMLGMTLNSVRRITVPSQLIFAARNVDQLPEATTEEGKRNYETIFKSGDATLVFEVYAAGINQGDNRI